MIFYADSESDLKTSPNQVKNQILSKIKFLWYFDLKFPQGTPVGAVRASHLAKKSKDKTPGVFVHAAFDFDTPGP